MRMIFAYNGRRKKRKKIQAALEVVPHEKFAKKNRGATWP